MYVMIRVINTIILYIQIHPSSIHSPIVFFPGGTVRKIFGFFGCLPVKFLFFPMGNGQKSPEKSDDLPAQNTASVSVDFRDFPAGTSDFPAHSSRFRLFSETESPSWVSFPLPLMHNDFICTQRTSFFLSGVCFLCTC